MKYDSLVPRPSITASTALAVIEGLGMRLKYEGTDIDCKDYAFTMCGAHN